jgi:hypothetical protein
MSANIPQPIVIEGGNVQLPEEGGMVEQKDKERESLRGPFDVEKHRAHITFCLLTLLALIIVGHYGSLVVMEWNGKKIDALSNTFHVALPTVAGLAGTVIAHYFTRK